MSKKLWGGRFNKQQDPEFMSFQNSICYDQVLALYDVKGSIAHVKMLSKCKIIPFKAGKSILSGLGKILKDIEKGTFKIDPKSEDIHTAIYMSLSSKIGDGADYLHTARSRNDQVILDLRMYSKDKLNLILDLTKKTQRALIDLAKQNIDVVMPGLTHTQHAMPILLSHQLLAYVSMLQRDIERLKAALISADEMPLGSCAMAGTSFAIDRKFVAKQLGFSKISENSIDAVSDRDFVIDSLYAIAMLFMHISRFCEDMILFSTSEFAIVDIDEAFCTGSSIMPQKKNPDALELIRGETSKAYANLNSLLVMMKGLPLSYNRDMQLDKKPLFSSVKLSEDVLSILTKLIKSIKINKEIAEEKIAADESIFALDIADYLVKKGLAFSEAHEITGHIVVSAIEKGIKISALNLDEFRVFYKKIDSDIFKIFDAKKSVMSKRSMGSTNPLLVRQQIDRWIKKIKG